MEHENKMFKPSLSLVALDFVGSILLGLGLAKMFAGIDFLPEFLQLDESGWTLIVLGILCMLPMLFQLFAKIREQAEKKLIK
jgi:hypothetical protein